jgi:hypothetical protein
VSSTPFARATSHNVRRIKRVPARRLRRHQRSHCTSLLVHVSVHSHRSRCFVDALLAGTRPRERYRGHRPRRTRCASSVVHDAPQSARSRPPSSTRTSPCTPAPLRHPSTRPPSRPRRRSPSPLPLHTSSPPTRHAADCTPPSSRRTPPSGSYVVP